MRPARWLLAIEITRRKRSFRTVEADAFCARNLKIPDAHVASICVGSCAVGLLDHLMARAGTSEPEPPGMPLFFVTAPTEDWGPW